MMKVAFSFLLRASAFFLVLLSPNVSAQPFFDLNATIDTVTIDLATNTTFSEAITLRYLYAGPDPDTLDITFNYTILNPNCEVVFAEQDNTSKALYFSSFDYTTETDAFYVKLGINLNLIEDASDLWKQDNGQTNATLSFCGRWNIRYKGDSYNYHETDIQANIDLKEGEGFDVTSVTVNLDRDDIKNVTEDVDISFPIEVFHCDDNADPLPDPQPTVFTQGIPIQLCMKLRQAVEGVYVFGIETMSYSASGVPEEQPVVIIATGASNNPFFTELDCTQQAGICRVKFIAVTEMFINDPNNLLQIVGEAIISFGADTTRRLVRTGFAPIGIEGRGLQDEEEVQFSPFAITLENLKPAAEEPKSDLLVPVTVGAVVGGVVLLAAVVAIVYFMKAGNSPTSVTIETKTKEDLTSDASEDSTSSKHNRVHEIVEF